MAVKIRLQRHGKKGKPFYWIVAADARSKRDGKYLEKIGTYDPNQKPAPPENPMSADRVKWEHIHRVFELCNRNVSETARRLKMHRRTLQRILSKRSPR